jgi:CheY-like chemotaxis protein
MNMTENTAGKKEPTAMHDSIESSGAKPRILVVEDDENSHNVMLAMLNKLGCRADLAVNGMEAVKALQHSDYSLVLMDCVMPEMDGYEATRQIRDPRTGARNPNVRIIAITSNGIPENRDECLRAGMNDYLLKPISMKDLATVLAKWRMT